MKKIQGDFNTKNKEKVKVEKNPRLETDLKAEELIRGEMVGLGKKGLSRYCFIYKDKLVNVTLMHLFVRDCNNLLSGESFSISLPDKYDVPGTFVVFCTEVKHTKPEWGK